MEGQMWIEERKFLYHAVLGRRPLVSLEVGTWKGGGSTLHIASALELFYMATALENPKTTKPILYTCETDTKLYQEAVDNFSELQLNQYVSFYNKSSTEMINHFIDTKTASTLEFIFFDGPEDPQLNIDDFKLLDKHLAVGTYFCMHDWDLTTRPDGLVSTKAKLIRPYLERLHTWKIVNKLTAPISVGIVLAQKIR